MYRLICRVSCFAKPRPVNGRGVESLYIAEIHHFLRAINIDINGAEDVLRLAVCKLYPAVYGLLGMPSSTEILSAAIRRSQPHKVLAVDISQLDTKLVTAKEGNNLFGILYHNTSGMA